MTSALLLLLSPLISMCDAVAMRPTVPSRATDSHSWSMPPVNRPLHQQSWKYHCWLIHPSSTFSATWNTRPPLLTGSNGDMLSCCVARKEHKSTNPTPRAHEPSEVDEETEAYNVEEGEPQEDGTSVWRLISDDAHTVLVHIGLNLVIEFANSSRGMVGRTPLCRVLQEMPDPSRDSPAPSLSSCVPLITFPT
jgi:hypothetical protein